MALSAPPTGAPRRPPRVPRPEPVPRVRSPRLAALAAAPEGAAEFWRTVEAEGTPLVEPDPDGDPAYAVVTFLWRGGDGTRAVLVLPNKVMDPRDPAGNLCERIPGTDVWHWSVRMRRDWRATYALCVDGDSGRPDAGDGPDQGGPDAEARGNSALNGAGPHAGTGGDGGRPEPAEGPAYWAWLRGRPRPDPLNARRFPRRWGGAPLSVVELPDAPGADGWTPRPGVPAGTVSRRTLPCTALGGGRTVWVYEPPGAAEARELPVLVLFDGEMWQPDLSVSVLLDNLIADGRIPPVLALLPESADSDTRWSELACGETFTDFLEHELLPWAGDHWPVTGDPGRTVLAGQSLGGLMAAYASLRAPHRFGNVLSQSGSFWWPDGPRAEWLTEQVRRSPRLPVRFRLSAGEQEWVLLPASRRLRDVLREKGYAADYREFNGGHDYLCWRTELADGLVALLGA